MKFVAFFRGINVGGNQLIKMANMKKALEASGFKNVKTILASGNAILEHPSKDARKVAEKVGVALEKKFDRRIRTIVRPIHDMEMLNKSNPFKGIPLTKETRFYVTFLDTPPKTHLKTSEKFFRVVSTCPFAVSWMAMVNAQKGSTDLMGLIEKHYGKDVTTRNWNTIQKILKATT